MRHILDLVDQPLLGIRSERGTSLAQLEEDDSEAPNVGATIVPATSGRRSGDGFWALVQ